MKHFRFSVRGKTVLSALSTAGYLIVAPHPASADITCYDFRVQSEAQAVYDALPGDPYGIDTGWPLPGVLGGGDQEAGNGVPCDATNDVPETTSPGDEEYTVGPDATGNGLVQLPAVELEQATVRDVPSALAIQTEENSAKLYSIMGVATPEFEVFANYEDREVPGQCGALAATNRLKELLPPGTAIWLQVDDTGFYTQNILDRQVWVEVGGRYRLVSEILVSEGRGVVATTRPGTGRGDAMDNPPSGALYRDALRSAQQAAIENQVGIWSECAV